MRKTGTCPALAEIYKAFNVAALLASEEHWELYQDTTHTDEYGRQIAYIREHLALPDGRALARVQCARKGAKDDSPKAFGVKQDWQVFLNAEAAMAWTKAEAARKALAVGESRAVKVKQWRTKK